MYEDDDQPSRRFRLLPMTVVMLGLLLVIKVNELYIGSRQLKELYGVREATAAEEKKDTAPAADTKKDEKKDAAPAADTKDVKKEEAPAADAKKEEGDKKEEAKSEGGEGDKAAKPPEEPKTFGTGKSTIKQIEELKAKNETPRFTKSEVDLLENLSKRRDELDQREKDLDVKSKVLDATQKRIDDKLAEMKTLEASLSKIVAQYNEKQDAQIASLVKIYEQMKPAQAAAIFNELDMTILLEVIDKMSERKVAPVLALMDPKKARDVTQELAAMRKSAPKVPATVGGAPAAGATGPKP